jgi:hypothetical protein
MGGLPPAEHGEVALDGKNQRQCPRAAFVTRLPQELDSTVAISGAPMSRAERIQ